MFTQDRQTNVTDTLEEFDQFVTRYQQHPTISPILKFKEMEQCHIPRQYHSSVQTQSLLHV